MFSRPPARTPAWLVSALLAFALLMPWGCDTREPIVSSSGPPAGNPSRPPDPDPPLESAPAFSATVNVVDENGDPIPTASYEVGESAGLAITQSPVGADGRFTLGQLDQPVVVIVEAPGFLPEPLVVDRESAAGDTTVRLLAEAGPSGERRIVMHFAGDVMMGRRYVDPTRDDTAVVTPGDGGVTARAVVSSVAPLFRAAHVRSLNLETVVGTFSIAEAYPRKRFLLQSPPEVLALLDELGADLITLGNNHARDWLDAGVQSTTDFLDGAGFAHVGAGVTAAAARAPRFLDVGGYRVGFLSYTTVNGDFVNDNLPLDAEPEPATVDPDEAWQYEMRSFGFSGPGVEIPAEPHRIGEAWRLFGDSLDSISGDAELADLWSALETVYPELQDWVARRGHGGANPYDASTLAGDIDDLRATYGCDLVVVQFHSGFQFLEVKSSFVETITHEAIEARADLVICHHPHVLQGFEWYRGKLIAHSLGNFVFDQDFLATFDSVVLRVVFQEDQLLEARCFPIVLDRYRPVPVGGRAARNIVQTLHERSVHPLRAERIDGGIYKIAQPPVGVLPRLVFERNTARIEVGAAARRTETVDIGANSVVPLSSPALTRSRGPGGASLVDIELGRDLLRWGFFEDVAADAESRGDTHWATNDSYKRVEVLPEGAPSGVRALRLRRSSANGSRVLVRPVARTTLAPHRAFQDSGGVVTPLDGEARYSVLFAARLSGGGEALLRFDVYDFDDTNPTQDPTSILIRSREYALGIPSDDAWHDVVFEVPPELYIPAASLKPNAQMVYLVLTPPTAGDSVLLADDLRFVEWRVADELPDYLFAVDVVRTASGAGVTVDLERTEE